MALPPELVQAYRKAIYVVSAPAASVPEIVLMIGEPNADLDELLDAEDAASGVFVTAANPHSRRQGAAENAEAFLRMNTLLAPTRYRRFAAEGRDPDGKWPAERGVFIAGMPRAEAQALGRALGQNAVVFVERGRAPELLLLA